MNINTAWYTDVGGRENNEDSVGVFEGEYGTLCIVADGLGGHEHGEIASQAALRTVKAGIYGKLSEEVLGTAIENANMEVVRLAGNERMNTTLAVLWIQNGNALVGSVGDTRIYQFRNNEIVFQSRDHSLAQLDVISGNEECEDVRKNPDRNKLIRVVGMQNGFKVDISKLDTSTGDAFLLCSDGFWEDVWENEMIQALRSSENANAWLDKMRFLLQTRLTASSDNNSAVSVVVSG